MRGRDLINLGLMITGFTAGAAAIAGLWTYNPGFAVLCVPMAASCLIVLASVLRVDPERPPLDSMPAVRDTKSAVALQASRRRQTARDQARVRSEVPRGRHAARQSAVSPRYS